MCRRPCFFVIGIYNYVRWRRTVPNFPLEKEPQGRGILFEYFKVSIPSNVFIIYLVRVGFEKRRNENELDGNTKVVFNYSLWRLWITQSLFKEQTIWSNSYNWKTGTDAPNLNNSLQNLVKEANSFEEKDPIWQEACFHYPMYHETEKNLSFQKILIRTNISGENAYARDKTFHVRDLAVPRVEQSVPPSTTILVCVI